MFLSKLILNLRDRLARRDLSRPYEMHRTLMNAYGRPRVENRCDLLFRMEPVRDRPPFVLVQTRECPDWSSLPDGYLLAPAESKTFEPRLSAGQKLRFRLRANPTKRVAAKNERLGGVMVDKRVGLATETEQIRWLLRKAEAGGFQIPGAWVEVNHPETNEPIQLPDFRVDAIPEGRDRNGKPGHAGALLAIRFEGLLVVTNAERFREALERGVGSGKAFGFGLLSVART